MAEIQSSHKHVIDCVSDDGKKLICGFTSENNRGIRAEMRRVQEAIASGKLDLRAQRGHYPKITCPYCGEVRFSNVMKKHVEDTCARAPAGATYP